jgi:hypothetical protein
VWDAKQHDTLFWVRVLLHPASVVGAPILRKKIEDLREARICLRLLLPERDERLNPRYVRR